MTAELLRRAADRIDELASKATPGPWHLDSHSELEKGCRCMSCWDKPWAYEVREIDGPDSPDGCFYNMHIGQDDAAYIATLGPQVAGPLAAWFRSQADETAMIDEMNAAASERAKRTGGDGHTFVIQPDRTAHATYLARAILGEDQ